MDGQNLYKVTCACFEVWNKNNVFDPSLTSEIYNFTTESALREITMSRIEAGNKEGKVLNRWWYFVAHTGNKIESYEDFITGPIENIANRNLATP